MWQTILKASDYRQPLYPIMTAAVLQFAGPQHSYTVSLLLNGLFFVITMFAIYGIMRVFTDKTNAVFPAILYAGMGFPLFYMHFAYSETATAMWVTLTLLFLFKSNGFSNRTMSVLAAFACVGGLLTRWVTPIFVLGGVLWELFLLCASWKKEKKNQTMFRLSNMALYVILTVFLSLFLYYLPNFEPFYAYTFRNSSGSTQWASLYRGAEYANGISVKSLVYYMNTISQNTIFFFVIFVSGIIISLFNLKKYGGLLLTFLLPYLVFSTIFLWKDDRFIVPLYPIIAVLAGLPMTVVKTSWKRLLLALIIILLSCLSYFGCMWGVGPMGKRGLTDIVLPTIIKHPRRIYLTSMVYPPVKEYINAHKVIQLVLANKNKKLSTVVVLINHEQLTNALFSIEQYYTFGEFSISASTQASNETLSTSDFVVTRNHVLDLDGETALCFDFIHAEYPQTYTFVGDVVIPSDESTVSVYKRQTRITGEMFESAGSICGQKKSI
jgi:hypothetical protein